MRPSSRGPAQEPEKLSGDTDEYAIAMRQETDLYRAVLGDYYPDKCRGKDFPTSAIGPAAQEVIPEPEGDSEERLRRAPAENALPTPKTARHRSGPTPKLTRFIPCQMNHSEV